MKRLVLMIPFLLLNMAVGPCSSRNLGSVLDCGGNVTSSCPSQHCPPAGGAAVDGSQTDEDSECLLPPACDVPVESAEPVRTIASCTGVDDTDVIQDAVTHADEVRLPVGTCVVSGLVAEKKAIKLTGQGMGRSILKYLARSTDGAVFFSNGGRTVITDLTIDGSRGTGAEVAGLFIRPKTCVGPVFVARVEIRNTAFTALLLSGAGSGNVNGIVDDGDGVGADGVWIFDTHLSNVGSGINVGASSAPPIGHVRIHDNVVQSDDVGIQLRGVHDGQVFHNLMTGGQSGVLLESGDFGISLKDNDVLGCVRAGISFGGGGLNTGADIVVSANRVSDCGDGVSVAHMTAGRFENITIEDNEVTHNRHSGVIVESGSHVMVTNNQLRGNTDAGLQFVLAPTLAGCGDRCTSVDDVLISHNVFRAEAALSSAGMLIANAAARGIRVTTNDLRHDVPVPPYRPVDLSAAPAAAELIFDDNMGWPTASAAP
ncbi:MAG: right-handed parallel beta-helix repeat-containing protein [Myxococcales bacterium]